MYINRACFCMQRERARERYRETVVHNRMRDLRSYSSARRFRSVFISFVVFFCRRRNDVDSWAPSGFKKNGFVCHILGFVASALFCFAVVICFGCFLDWRRRQLSQVKLLRPGSHPLRKSMKSWLLIAHTITWLEVETNTRRHIVRENCEQIVKTIK